jgi:hypothetical protein
MGFDTLQLNSSSAHTGILLFSRLQERLRLTGLNQGLPASNVVKVLVKWLAKRLPYVEET